MAETMDMVHRRPLGTDRPQLLTDLLKWAAQALDHRFDDPALLIQALTHPSHGQPDYQRLEFLGDRVLGLVVAAWLYERFPTEPEGKLSSRLNALVTGAVCADVARGLGPGLRQHLRLGKQAREDGAADSDNVLGDIIEALIGAMTLDGGIDVASRFIRKHWAARLDGQTAAPKHPKSALQEWTAARNLPPPQYALVRRSGAHHAPRFQVEVLVKGYEPATAEGGSKQEAETRAANAMLEQLKK